MSDFEKNVKEIKIRKFKSLAGQEYNQIVLRILEQYIYGNIPYERINVAEAILRKEGLID